LKRSIGMFSSTLQLVIVLLEELEDIKVVIRIRKSKKDRQCNG